MKDMIDELNLLVEIWREASHVEWENTETSVMLSECADQIEEIMIQYETD